MLEEFMGIPAHPLLVHAAVVFVPLLAVLAIAYAFVPFVRSHTRWVLGLLALGAPIAAFLAKLSGDAFFARLEARDSISEEYYPKLEAHQASGNMTLYASIALAVLSLLLVYLVRPASSAGHAAGRTSSSRVVSVVLGVLCLAAAAASLYYVIRTGDSGAKAVWNGS